MRCRSWVRAHEKYKELKEVLRKRELQGGYGSRASRPADGERDSGRRDADRDRDRQRESDR